MATIYAVMFDIIVWKYPQCGAHEHVQICSYVNIRYHLETFQALSTNFVDNPCNIMGIKDKYWFFCFAFILHPYVFTLVTSTNEYCV